MSRWQDVKCPREDGGCGRKLGRIARGLAEYPCRHCRMKVWASSDGKRLAVGMRRPIDSGAPDGHIIASA